METGKKKIQELELDKERNVQATKTMADIVSSYKQQQ
jgi:hypothetical protein